MPQVKALTKAQTIPLPPPYLQVNNYLLNIAKAESNLQSSQSPHQVNSTPTITLSHNKNPLNPNNRMSSEPDNHHSMISNMEDNVINGHIEKLVSPTSVHKKITKSKEPKHQAKKANIHNKIAIELDKEDIDNKKLIDQQHSHRSKSSNKLNDHASEDKLNKENKKEDDISKLMEKESEQHQQKVRSHHHHHSHDHSDEKFNELHTKEINKNKKDNEKEKQINPNINTHSHHLKHKHNRHHPEMSKQHEKRESFETPLTHTKSPSEITNKQFNLSKTKTPNESENKLELPIQPPKKESNNNEELELPLSKPHKSLHNKHDKSDFSKSPLTQKAKVNKDIVESCK